MSKKLKPDEIIPKLLNVKRLIFQKKINLLESMQTQRIAFGFCELYKKLNNGEVSSKFSCF